MAAPQIHPTAVLEGPVELDLDVVVGPLAVIRARADAPVRIGAGTRLLGRCWVEGPLTMGSRNVVYPEVTLGLAPQDLKWNADEAGAGLSVGDGNVFREGVTIHRATSREKPTRIGDRNYFMAHSHAGHDAAVGSDCIFANSTLLGGHVNVADRVITGGNTAVHQFVRLGRLSMISGAMGLSRDLPPFFMLTGINIAGGLNLIGMRRNGFSRDDIDDVRWAQRTLYHSGRSMRDAASILAERADRPRVRELVEFISASKRAICDGRPNAMRGNFSVQAEED